MVFWLPLTHVLAGASRDLVTAYEINPEFLSILPEKKVPGTEKLLRHQSGFSRIDVSPAARKRR
jgi:hypothetical protein